jgi:starvation-inducible DNA-binding protein
MATGVEIEPTRMGVASVTRSRGEIAEGLSRLMADTLTLYLETHGSHRIVAGPRFHTLHSTFEEQVRYPWQAIAPLAEWIRALEFAAPGSVGGLAKLASAGEADGVAGADRMVRRLVRDHEVGRADGPLDARRRRVGQL